MTDLKNESKGANKNTIYSNNKYTYNEDEYLQSKTVTENNNDLQSTYSMRDYMGGHDSKGRKAGFGIKNMPDGSVFKGVFANNQANGWGIYITKDGDIFRGEYEDDRTSGYGEYSKGFDVSYFGYWVDDTQFGIGYELWSDSSKYIG